MAGIGDHSYSHSVPRDTGRSPSTAPKPHPIPSPSRMVPTLLWAFLSWLGHSHWFNPSTPCNYRWTNSGEHGQDFGLISLTSGKHLIPISTMQHTNLTYPITKKQWRHSIQKRHQLFLLVQAALYKQPIETILDQPLPHMQQWVSCG